MKTNQPKDPWWRTGLLALSIWVFILSPSLGFAWRRLPGEMIPNGAQPEIYLALISSQFPAGQTFRAARDNLVGIGINLEVAPGAGRPEWEFLLATGDGEPLYRGEFTPPEGVGRRVLWFRFPPIPDSRGRPFLFWIRRALAEQDRVLIAWGSSYEHYPEGELLVPGGALPGDIAFRTLYEAPGGDLLQAPPPTPHHTPPWFAGPPVPVLLALTLSVAILVLLLILVRRTLRPVPRWSLIPVAVVGLASVIYAAVGEPVHSFELSPGGPDLSSVLPGVKTSLVRELTAPETEIEEGGGLVTIRGDLGPDGPQAVLFMHPDLGGEGPPSAVFHLDLPEQPLLRFVPWLDPEAIRLGSDGVDFQVSLRDRRGEDRVLYQYYLSPLMAGSRDPVEVDLSPWGGERVNLILRTFPGPLGNTLYDWAGWGDPVVISRK